MITIPAITPNITPKRIPKDPLFDVYSEGCSAYYCVVFVIIYGFYGVVGIVTVVLLDVLFVELVVLDCKSAAVNNVLELLPTSFTTTTSYV